MGKRWTDPDYLAGLEESADALDRIKFWRSPVFAEKFWNVPAFLLPRLSEMAAEVPDTQLGRRIYYERAHCLIVLASTAGRTDPVSFRLDEPPTESAAPSGRAA